MQSAERVVRETGAVAALRQLAHNVAADETGAAEHGDELVGGLSGHHRNPRKGARAQARDTGTAADCIGAGARAKL